MASKDKKSKDSKDVGQMASRKKNLSRKTRKYIRHALLENYPGMAKKYNKADLDKVIDKQYELDTILPYAPIYYQEDKVAAPVDSKPVKKRLVQGQLIRHKTLNEAERGIRSPKRGVKYDYPTSSPNRDLESGLKHYDFSGRDENYDPEAGKNGGRKATRTSRKSMKTRKTRK
jgi:hypothetical protein